MFNFITALVPDIILRFVSMQNKFLTDVAPFILIIDDRPRRSCGTRWTYQHFHFAYVMMPTYTLFLLYYGTPKSPCLLFDIHFRVPSVFTYSFLFLSYSFHISQSSLTRNTPLHERYKVKYST